MPEWLYLCAGNKKPLHLRGYGFVASPLISRNYPAGIGTLSCDIAGGLPGFIGPYPSTSLDETMLLHIFSCASTFVNQYKLLLLQLYATGGLLVNVELRTY